MNHPITLPSELVSQWLKEFHAPAPIMGMEPGEALLHVAAVAARWGADQELDAACEWVNAEVPLRPDGSSYATQLRAARRTLSLKQQALAILSKESWHENDEDIIRRALELIPDSSD